MLLELLPENILLSQSSINTLPFFFLPGFGGRITPINLQFPTPFRCQLFFFPFLQPLNLNPPLDPNDDGSGLAKSNSNVARSQRLKLWKKIKKPHQGGRKRLGSVIKFTPHRKTNSNRTPGIN